jgi:hypothetical protein
LPLVNGEFADRFGGYDVHLYRVRRAPKLYIPRLDTTG